MKDLTKCKDEVLSSSGSFFMHRRQCRRKAWKDGYCRQHHPETVAKRKIERRERWNEKQENSPCAKIKRAEARIKELEAELRRLEEVENV